MESKMAEIRYPVIRSLKMSTIGWRKDRSNETKHQHRESRKLVLEDQALNLDDDESNWGNARHVIVVSRVHHLENIESSNKLLELLNIHHGPARGFSDGYEPKT